MITLEELKERLAKQYDELELIEELEITTEDIVNRFDDYIIEDFDRLAELVEQPSQTEEEQEDELG